MTLNLKTLDSAPTFELKRTLAAYARYPVYGPAVTDAFRAKVEAAKAAIVAELAERGVS